MRKKFNGSDFVKHLLKNGWKQDGDRISRDLDPPVKKKSSRKKRTFDQSDHINLRNKQELSPFKSFIEMHLKIEVWSEYYFSPDRGFRIDFALPDYKIAIEIDGGIWMRGKSGHSSGSGIKRDQEKTTLLSSLGWSVLRFEPNEAMSLRTLEIIKNTIKSKRAV